MTRFNHELDDELIERARALRPLLAQHAAQAEEERRPTAEAMRAIEEAGLFGLAVPQRWGGLGVSSNTWGRVGVELAKGDASTAWAFHILQGGAWIASLSGDELQEDLFADGIPRVAGGVNPPGTLVPVDGGYRLTGRWGYNSGCEYATWAHFACKIVEADGAETMGVTAYVPFSEVEIERDWGAIGMRGSGSHSTIVDDVFIPAHRVIHPDRPAGTHEPGKRHVGAPSDYWPQMYPPRAPFLGLLIGIADAALEATIDRAHSRPVVYTTYARQMDSPVVQRDIGHAGAMIDSARMTMDRVTQRLDELAERREEIAYEERCRNRGQIAFAVDCLCGAVDRLMSISGSSAFMETNELQRYWRDLNTAARHANLMVNVGYELSGRARLGVEPNLMPANWI